MTPHTKNDNVLNSLKFESVGEIFNKAITLPASSFFGSVVSDYDKRKIKVAGLKKDVLAFIRAEREATMSEIAEKFDATLDEVALMLKELESEGKISIR